MTRIAHNAALFLLLAFLVNTGGWTFDRAILEDIVFEAQRTSVSADSHYLDLGSTNASAEHDGKTQNVCNHGCHFLTHFQGEISQDFQWSVAAMPQERIAHTRSTPSSYSPTTPLRPPRLLAWI